MNNQKKTSKVFFCDFFQCYSNSDSDYKPDSYQSLSYIHHVVSFLLSTEAKNFCAFRKREKSEFRAVIKHLCLKGLTPKEIKVELDEVHGTSAPVFETVYCCLQLGK